MRSVSLLTYYGGEYMGAFLVWKMILKDLGMALNAYVSNHEPPKSTFKGQEVFNMFHYTYRQKRLLL